jgi:hypothetical protein
MSFVASEVKSTAGLVQWGSLVFLLAGYLLFAWASAWDLFVATMQCLGIICIISSQQMMYRTGVKVEGERVVVKLGTKGRKSI